MVTNLFRRRIREKDELMRRAELLDHQRRRNLTDECSTGHHEPEIWFLSLRTIEIWGKNQDKHDSPFDNLHHPRELLSVATVRCSALHELTRAQESEGHG